MTHQNILLSHYINLLKFLVVYIYMRNWQNWKVYFQSLAKVSFSRRHWVKKANNWSLSCPPQHLVAEVGYRNWRQDRTATKGILYKKVFLKLSQKVTEKHLCQSLFFNKACNLTRKETLEQVFSCEFCKFFKKNFFTEQEVSSIFWEEVSRRKLNTKNSQVKDFHSIYSKR